MHVSELLSTEENMFSYFCSSGWSYYDCASYWVFDCAGVNQGKEGLERVRRTLRGSKGSLTSPQRGSQRSDAWQPCLQASTGCLQGILQEVQDFYRKSHNFYRMFCSRNLG